MLVSPHCFHFERPLPVLLDRSRLPVVFIRTEANAETPINDQIEALLEERRPFVLVTDHAPDDHDEDTQEERKERALFFKKIKDRMRAYCRGMIVIDGGRPMSPAIKIAAVTAGKAFGFAIVFAVDEAEAERKGRSLLGSRDDAWLL